MPGRAIGPGGTRPAVTQMIGNLNLALRRWLPRGSTLPDAVWAQRHRRILLLLWLHIPGLFVFSLTQHLGVIHSLVEATVVAAFAFWATILRSNRRLSTVIAALGLLTCSAVLVHVSGGVVEMHFHYFVMVGVVTLYQDWWPFLIAIGYVFLQHGVAGVIAPASVYNHADAVAHPWRWAGIHGLFVMGMSAAGIASWRLNEVLLQATADREEKLSEAQAVARLGSWKWDVESATLTASDEFHRLFGIDSETAFSWEPLLDRVHADDREAAETLLRTLESGAVDATDFRIVLADGGFRWLHCRGKVTDVVNGRAVSISGTAQDITDRKRAEAELREALSLLSATLESTADGLLVVDGQGSIASFNQKFVEMWRIPESILASRDDAQAIGFVLGQLRDPDAFVAKVNDLYAQPSAESHDTLEFLDGRVFERYSKPQRVGGTTVGRVWSFRDVTEHKRLEDELAHQAFHDSLTNLANQALFRDRVQHALARAARHETQLAVLFLDLDNFKNVNDSLGHAAGDELLVAVAERLRGCLRTADTAARLGGDEFALLLEDIESVNDATATAERMLAVLGRPFSAGGREVFVAASIGIALAAPGTSNGQLLRNADIAMYTAKQRGKGCYQIFEAEMYAAAVDRLEIEADLRRALQRAELTLDYQPIVAFDTGAIMGVEALVRWHHPKRGLLSPAAFIPIAEETGLIHDLGRQVISAACTQARQWQLRHPTTPPISISVNVSPRQIQTDGLVADVADALARSELPASSLILEITEGAMMPDVEATVAKLDALKALGVRLAIDDFGTGYSSLSYLARLPIDILKIDRAFVSSIETHEDRASLVGALVSLAQTLHLNAVAEGVESGAQAQILADLGCGLGQGYFLARPMDGEAIDELLKAGSVGLAAVPRGVFA
jgi:diguanylate cyclase (GGDEF)-like protein/PAS domain S-box-containing protein